MGVSKTPGQSVVGEGASAAQGTKSGSAHHSLWVAGQGPCRLGIAAVSGQHGPTTTFGCLRARRGFWVDVAVSGYAGIGPGLNGWVGHWGGRLADGLFDQESRQEDAHADHGGQGDATDRHEGG